MEDSDMLDFGDMLSGQRPFRELGYHAWWSSLFEFGTLPSSFRLLHLPHTLTNETGRPTNQGIHTQSPKTYHQ